MNKILVEVSVGELFDKISILEIKKDKIKDEEKLKYIVDEYNLLKEQMVDKVKLNEKLSGLFDALKDINSKLWVIEDDKRLCEKNSDFGEKFIKLSRDVHFLNDSRAKIKLEMNNHTGSKIKEIILCEDNLKDIEEINKKYLKGLTFRYVNEMREVIKYAITDQKVRHAKSFT